jgi:hypothetical protein
VCLLPHQGGKFLINCISYLSRPPVITQFSSISSAQCCTQFWLVWVRLINYYIIIIFPPLSPPPNAPPFSDYMNYLRGFFLVGLLVLLRSYF